MILILRQFLSLLGGGGGTKVIFMCTSVLIANSVTAFCNGVRKSLLGSCRLQIDAFQRPSGVISYSWLFSNPVGDTGSSDFGWNIPYKTSCFSLTDFRDYKFGQFHLRYREHNMAICNVLVGIYMTD